MADEALAFSRIHVEIANRQRVFAIFDFAVGEYISTQTFFDELSRIQHELTESGTARLNSGQVADLETTGGALAIQLFMETLDSARQVMSGLARLGLTIEKQVWKLQ